MIKVHIHPWIVNCKVSWYIYGQIPQLTGKLVLT